jgi:phosphoadenosine phosphosulfate reductase
MNQIIVWDLDNNVPKVQINEAHLSKNKAGKYISTDIRPVFLPEKYLVHCLFPELGEEIMNSSVWNASNNHYYIDGIKLEQSIYQRFLDCDLFKLKDKVSSFIPTKEQIEYQEKYLSNFVEANKNHFMDLVDNTMMDNDDYPIGAKPFIRSVIKRFNKRTPIVSFSGGKDSTVISHLVRSAIGQNEILHVNADTTIEFPSTYEYMSRFQESNNDTPFFIESVGEESGVNNFFDLAKKIGPPSRVKSWCCSIFKTGPMGDAFANMNENWLTFYGVRRSESASRNKYDRISISPKIEKQIVTSPIIDWKDVDIWLYILTENLDFNDAYKQGFSRVGCWCCPNNSQWSDILMAIYNHDHYMAWHNFLIEFARSIGKKDYNEYVATGKWKARQGGAGIENILSHRAVVKYERINDFSRAYVIRKDLDKLKLSEFFKPFGYIESNIGVKSNSSFVVVNKNNIELIRVDIKCNTIRISLNDKAIESTFNKTSIKQHIWSYIDKQLRKYQICIYCQACIATCPFGALTVDNDDYIIDEEKCQHCLKCINHFPKGCLIASALAVKKSEEK